MRRALGSALPRASGAGPGTRGKCPQSRSLSDPLSQSHAAESSGQKPGLRWREAGWGPDDRDVWARPGRRPE